MYYHFVWSTKYRRKVLVGSIAEDLHWLHEFIVKQKGIILINQEIMPDHVHLFVTAHPIFAPANIAKIIKGITAKKFLKSILNYGTSFGMDTWNPSYYVGTCGDATKDVIERYVEMQKVK